MEHLGMETDCLDCGDSIFTDHPRNAGWMYWRGPTAGHDYWLCPTCHDNYMAAINASLAVEAE